MDLIDPDLLLGIRTGDLRLVERAAKLVAMNRFDSACVFDYRRVEPALRNTQAGCRRKRHPSCWVFETRMPNRYQDACSTKSET